MKKSEFYKHPNMSRISSGLRGCGIILYIFGGMDVLSIFRFQYDDMSRIMGTVAGLLVCILGFLIHICQSRAAAITLTALGAISMIITILLSGYFSGWLDVVVGAMAIMYTFEFHKAWKQYQETGIVPIDSKKMF